MRLKSILASLLFCVFFIPTIRGQDAVTRNPDSAKIITSDIDQFWIAFDALTSKITTDDSLRTIDAIFINRASDGLRQYMKAADCHAACYLQAIRAHRPDYLKIRIKSAELKHQKEQIVQYIRRLKQIYPALKIPVICLTIGKFEVGGTQFENTLFVGYEVDLLQAVDIPVQTIHELAHYQQKTQDPQTNLELALVEGGAEWTCYQVTGKRTIYEAWSFGLKNEESLWREFRPGLDSPINMKWFLNSTDSLTRRPGSLGYFIGFQICESYLKHQGKDSNCSYH